MTMKRRFGLLLIRTSDFIYSHPQLFGKARLALKWRIANLGWNTYAPHTKRHDDEAS